MIKEREALKLALEALEYPGNIWHMNCPKDKSITAIKEALAQPEHEWLRGECVNCGQSIERQEPVAWVSEIAEEAELMLEKPRFQAVPLYTTPLHRKPLTDEEITAVWEKKVRWHAPPIGITDIEFARAIEAAHGIKD